MPSLLSRLYGSVSSTPATPEKWLVEWFRGPTTAAGVYVDPNIAERSTAVWCAVRLLSEGIAGLPLLLYRQREAGGRTSRERARDSDVYQLVHRKPNRWQTPFEFFEMCGAHLVLRGHFYAQKLYDRSGTLRELMPLHPDKLTPQVGGPELFYYKYQPSQGEPRDFLPSELFRTLAHSTDGISGRSCITVCREAVASVLVQEEFAASFFARGANPSGVLSHPNKLDEEAYKRLREDWKARHEGSGNAGSTVILEEGMKWEQLGMKLSDAQFIEEREFGVNDIARLFRVPPHKLGDLRRATFSNIEHQSLEYLQDSLSPWLKRIEQAAWRDLLSESEQEDHYFEFLVDAVLRADFKSRMEGYAIARTYGILSANECRERENLNARDDDGGDEYLHPANMEVDSSGLITVTPGGQQLPPPAAPQPPRRLPPAQEEEGEGEGEGARARAAGAQFAAILADPFRRMARREAQLLSAALAKGAQSARQATSRVYATHAEQLEQALAEPWRSGLALTALAIRQPPLQLGLEAALTAYCEQFASARAQRWSAALNDGGPGERAAVARAQALLAELEEYERPAQELAQLGLALLYNGVSTSFSLSTTSEG